jgi:hypothetical protein
MQAAQGTLPMQGFLKERQRLQGKMAFFLGISQFQIASLVVGIEA